MAPNDSLSKNAGAPKLAAVIGWPIAQSLSPTIHNCWARREGAAAYYVPVAAGEERFEIVVRGLKAAGFRGANVTHPYKERALELADAASETAAKIGAANMLSFDEDRIFADNSDSYGFAAGLSEPVGEIAPRTALVLGAGGAAKAIVAALADIIGVDTITIANRTRARAEALARLAPCRVVDWSERETAVSEADIIVNTTALGMTGARPLALPLDRARADAVVCDIVYAPLMTPLLEAARARGLKTVDGLSMLMHQAVRGYCAWLGETAVVDAALREELIAAIAARGAA